MPWKHLAVEDCISLCRPRLSYCATNLHRLWQCDAPFLERMGVSTTCQSCHSHSSHLQRMSKSVASFCPTLNINQLRRQTQCSANFPFRIFYTSIFTTILKLLHTGTDFYFAVINRTRINHIHCNSKHIDISQQKCNVYQLSLTHNIAKPSKNHNSLIFGVKFSKRKF